MEFLLAGFSPLCGRDPSVYFLCCARTGFGTVNYNPESDSLNRYVYFRTVGCFGVRS